MVGIEVFRGWEAFMSSVSLYVFKVVFSYLVTEIVES